MPHTQSNNGGGIPVFGDRSKLLERLPVSEEDLERYRERAMDLDRQARTFIRENPTAVVLGAVAVGFLVGRILSRR